MKRFMQFTLFASLLWFIYPDEAWCGGCKKCNQRAVELRKRLLEQQKQEAAKEPNKAAQGYDVSMTDWNSDPSQKKDKDKDAKDDKIKKKKKKDKGDKSKSSSSTSGGS